MADGKVVYEIRGDNSKFQSDVNQTENIAKSKQSSIGGFAKAAVVGIGAAVAAVGAGIVKFSADAIGVGSEFDKSMSQVAATMGVTADEIENLRNFAMDMGATTAFSATEAAQALNYMALAGYDAKTSMKMLPNVLNLAAAGNMDLARASDMVTDTQSALGLSLEDTTLLVDKMAKASSKSNTSVEQLGDAMLTVGGTAKNLKGGTTELATMLGVLADNGIKGAEGGTALRNVILALSAPTDQAAAALDALGVSAYDAGGNMRALPDVFADLNAAMDGMTQGEKTDVLNTVFNKVDLKSANALLATSADRFNDLSTAIDGATGAAEQMASTQLDNLAGDVTLFKSALEGAKITLSNSLTPALRKFVQFGTREIGKLDNAFKRGGIEGFSDQLGKTLGKAVNTLIKKIPQFVQVAGKLAFSLVDTIGNSLVMNFPNLLKKGLQAIRDLSKGIIDRIPKIMGGIGSIIGDVIANIPNLLDLAWNIISGLAKGIIEGIPKAFAGIGDGFVGMFKKPLSEETQAAIGELETLKSKLDEIGMDADTMYDKVSGAEADAGKAEYWLGVFDDLKGKTNLTKIEQEKLNSAVAYLNENVLPETKQLVQDETGAWSLNTEEIRNNIQAMKDRKIAEIYLEKANGELEKMVEIEIELDRQNDKLFGLQGKKNELQPAIEKMNSEWETYQSDLKGVLDANSKNVFSWNAGTKAMKEYAESVGITSDNFESWAQVSDAIREQQKPLRDEWQKTNDGIAATTYTIKTLEKGYASYDKTVQKYMDKSAEYAAQAKKNADAIVDGFVGGMSSSGAITKVSGAAGNLARAALDEMKRVAMIQSPSKRARKEIGENIGRGEALGLEDSIPEVKKASEKLINSIDFDVPSADIPTVTAGGENDTRINAIIAVLNKYLPRIGAPIVLDTGELVGATVDKYDYELGVLQQRRARYE